jgi:hypothetical protein
MSDVYEHNIGDHEDPVPSATWLIGFLGAVLLLVICLGITALAYSEQHVEFVDKVETATVEQLQQLRQEQEARLNAEPHWQITKTDAGEDKALIIPLDQAMQAVIGEYRGKNESGGK